MRRTGKATAGGALEHVARAEVRVGQELGRHSVRGVVLATMALEDANELQRGAVGAQLGLEGAVPLVEGLIWADRPAQCALMHTRRLLTAALLHINALHRF
jgi:hypothetical protein